MWNFSWCNYVGKQLGITQEDWRLWISNYLVIQIVAANPRETIALYNSNMHKASHGVTALKNEKWKQPKCSCIKE